MSDTFTFQCADGYRIGATRYEPSHPIRAQILMGGATAVPQGFYKRFAEHAMRQGFGVTTMDYRGVGASAPKHLRGFKMNYLDWARQDLSGALDLMDREGATKPIYLFGHSYGGHAFGLMSNHAKIKACYTFATGAGWAGHMPPTERFKVNLLWHFLGPVIVSSLGYMPGRFIGGQNLPLDVYKQWKRWCSFPNYFFDDPSMGDAIKHFAQVSAPIAAATALDDLWASPISRDHFFRGYTNAPVTRVDLDPAVLGYPLGHMGYFRKGREALWDNALQWCEQQT
jgi:predicted alpha/beta hydrolase